VRHAVTARQYPLRFQATQGAGMTLTQKIILIALLVVGGLCLIVGFTLMHYIGGFLRTVEEEKTQEDEAPRQSVDSQPPKSDGGANTKT